MRTSSDRIASRRANASWVQVVALATLAWCPGCNEQPGVVPPSIAPAAAAAQSVQAATPPPPQAQLADFDRPAALTQKELIEIRMNLTCIQRYDNNCDFSFWKERGKQSVIGALNLRGLTGTVSDRPLMPIMELFGAERDLWFQTLVVNRQVSNSASLRDRFACARISFEIQGEPTGGEHVWERIAWVPGRYPQTIENADAIPLSTPWRN